MPELYWHISPSSIVRTDVVCLTRGVEGAADGAAAGDEDVMMLDASEDEPTAVLSRGQVLLRASKCGFLGLPRPGTGHYFGDNSPDAHQTDARNVKLSRLGNDAKSAIQEQQSKTLGLRSLG